MKAIALAAYLIAQQGCPTCDSTAIKESIYGQIVHSKGDGSARDYACGAMLHVKGQTERFLKSCGF